MIVGAGYSSSRRVGEVLTNSYGCFPHVRNGEAVLDAAGVEMFVSTRAFVPLDYDVSAAEKVLHRGVACVVEIVYERKIE